MTVAARGVCEWCGGTGVSGNGNGAHLPTCPYCDGTPSEIIDLDEKAANEVAKGGPRWEG